MRSSTQQRRRSSTSYYLSSIMNLPREDTTNILLLIVLYLIQGIPLGLVFGSLPALLQKKASYSQLGLFSLAGYPYSLKLFWSPIVDSVYIEKVGRRKSWILPVQLITGLLLFYLSSFLDELVDGAFVDVEFLTIYFFVIVFFTATQDIAVDGWAISILSNQNLTYAATCQTIGLNTGFFLSYTVFLALNGPRGNWGLEPPNEPLVTVGQYVCFWAAVYLVITLFLVLKEESPFVPEPGDDLDVISVYKKMFMMVMRPSIYKLLFVLITCKVSFATVDSVASIALLERGFRREDMAFFALIEFPFQIGCSILIGKLSAGHSPLAPWMAGYKIKIVATLLSMFILHNYPAAGEELSTSYYITILFVNLVSSMGTACMFVAFGCFFARISDPSIGGTYLTLLNTCSNFGGTWPKYYTFLVVDYFTVRHCITPEGFPLQEITDKAECVSRGAAMVLDSDGYFPVTTALLIFGVLYFYLFLKPKLSDLQKLPQTSWLVNPPSSSSAASLSASLNKTERRD